MKIIIWILVAAVLLLLLIQVLPIGRNHTNPPVVQEPAWDSPQTRELAKRACFDCHSNETVWPWYSNIAPISWLIQNDVDEGRNAFNFSDWSGGAPEAEEMGEVIQEGQMPPLYYVMLHSQAKLSAEEKQALQQGLSRLPGLGTRQGGEGGEGGGDEDD